MARTAGRRAGVFLLTAASAIAAAAPVLAPHDAERAFPALLNAPPTMLHVRERDGSWHRPFIRELTIVSRLERRYAEERRVPLVWFTHGKLVSSADDDRAPLLLLGADAFGRDVFSRLLVGARVSLGLALVASALAAGVGALFGAVAGYAGGAIDDAMMRLSDFVLVLPMIYVALALRSALPLVLSGPSVFLLLGGIFAVLGAPFVTRGVRAIVRSERQLDYASAAISVGAGHARVLFRHLLPAAFGFIGVQLTVLLPTFILAEATLSYVGLGFPDTVPSWGVMLHDASNVSALSQAPWLLSPAVAIFIVVLGVNLAVQDDRIRMDQ